MGNNCACLIPKQQQEDQDKKKTKKIRRKNKKPTRVSDGRNPFSEDPATTLVLKNLPSLVPLIDKYSLGPELGRGEFGITYLCKDKETDESFACKSVAKSKLRTPIEVEDVRREVAIMLALPTHPNIVRLRSAHEDPAAVHLVMELCGGGELFDRVTSRGRYGERAAAAFLRDIAEAVRTCHDNGVMHRDLKPENFLFENNKVGSRLKVIDFGLSAFFQPGERFSEIVGSPYYMAPEVLRRNYGPEIDVWSAGVILYILLCGLPPFWADSEHGVAQAILCGEIDFESDPWPKVSDGAKCLILLMLEQDPKLRLTAQEVLEHPWLQNAKEAPKIPLEEIVKARLKQFSAMNKFKKKVMRVIAEHLAVEEVQVISDMFKLMDTDNNGKITFEQLRAGLQMVGSKLCEPEMKMLMEVADVDRNGVLNYGEFVAVSFHLQKVQNVDEHLHRAFEFFDVDGSGYIEMDELREALAGDSGQTEDRVLDDILLEVDTDEDGRISFEEFVTMMKTGADRRNASPPRHYSTERFRSMSTDLEKEGSGGRWSMYRGFQ